MASDRSSLFAEANSTLLVAAAAMLWGSDLLLRPQVLASGWSPSQVVLGEHLLLLLLFLLPLWHGRRSFLTLTRSQWAALVFIAWGGSAMATVLYTQAFVLGAPLIAVLLQKTQPVFALALAGAVLREKRSFAFWIWCFCALLGALVIVLF